MQRRVRDSPRFIAALVILAAGGAILAINLSAHDPTSPTQSTGAAEPGLAATPVAGRFAHLSSAHSNRCDLAAGELRHTPAQMRLQSSCCFPMDLARYKQQLHDLRAYRRNGLVPRDPYDVPASLAKRLLQYRSIVLSPQQRAIYRRATKLSSLGGPCCCPCWRWQAFKGQADFLISHRQFSAVRVADLWGLEEGCGGPASA